MKSFKSIVTHRIFIALVSFLVGAVAFWAYQRAADKNRVSQDQSRLTSEDEFLNDFFNKDFFDRSRDPYEEMRRMRERMLDQFGDRDGGAFDDWYKGRFGGGDVGEVTQREDKDFLYLEINLNGQTPKNFNVNVENGQVVISGETEDKKPDGSLISSRFERSFPVPSGVDAEKFKLEQESGKIIIKFPKHSG